jgi:RNA polymerase sigma-70 factor, ECF subfamily
MYLASEVPPRGGTASCAVQAALSELEAVYGFIYSRVGNRHDTEDLIQQVALKALPRLSDAAPAEAVRGYLYATARSVLATFWKTRLRLRESELREDICHDGRGKELLPSPENAACVARILNGLTPDHRRVLELRFLKGQSLREAADEMGKTIGSVKLMQLRALRKAAAIGNPSDAP